MIGRACKKLVRLLLRRMLEIFLFTIVMTTKETSAGKTHLPLLESNRRHCGGDIEIAIEICRPLIGKELLVVAFEELVISHYPEPVASLSELNSRHTIQMTLDDQPTLIVNDQGDPHNLDLILSYDVVNEEVTQTHLILKTELLENINSKLLSLIGSIAIENRDANRQIDSVASKRTLAEDRVLMSRLVSLNRRLGAARALHRVKIMEMEIVGGNGKTCCLHHDRDDLYYSSYELNYS
ncbi:uncharacterized protein CCR75_003102 [Bremia lactucae]|uniref:Uncharacterized protein n=1 Tax=Bremia lactucae TaxID=4779 RepID=A0A976NYS7_BRELC|nr:hypothetical protein CCR75_003102 [Bremia lactucae]